MRVHPPPRSTASRSVHLPADAFVWLDLREPDEALMGRIQALFGLHELAAEDAHRAHQRPKAERYGDCLFVACLLYTSRCV